MTGSLAMLEQYDSTSKPACDGDSELPIDLTGDDPDEDDRPGPSRRRAPTPRPNGHTPLATSGNLFDEGVLRPSSSSQSDVPSDASEEPDLLDISNSEDSPENLISPASPPSQSIRPHRQAYRPNLQLNPSPTRRYRWLARKSRSPSSITSSRSGGSRKSTSNHRASPKKTNLRGPASRMRQRVRHDERERRKALDRVAGEAGEVGKSGRRVQHWFTFKSAPGGKHEMDYMRRQFTGRRYRPTSAETLTFRQASR